MWKGALFFVFVLLSALFPAILFPHSTKFSEQIYYAIYIFKHIHSFFHKINNTERREAL